MLGIIAVIATFVISLLWFIPQYKIQENKKYTIKDYILLFVFPGLFFTCILIIIFEISWDIIFKHINISNLSKELIGSFFRAALIEEFFKFHGFMIAKRNIKLKRKSDYMLIGGFIGLTYGIVEKAVLGNIAAAIIGTMIPLHFIWQFNQAKHIYEHDKAVLRGDKACAKKEMLKAIIIPFVLHGCWDAALTIVGALTDSEKNLYSVLGVVFGLVLCVIGFIYVFKSLKYGRRIIKNDNIADDVILDTSSNDL